jgi:Flp pilus assembly protein TadG
MAPSAQSLAVLRRPPRRRGAAAIEFAMTVPVLFLLLFGALELGRMNMIRQTANNAAYEAARCCAVPGATAAEGVAAAQKLLSSIGANGATITITPATIVNSTTSVTATVTIPYSTNVWVKPLYATSGSATATCTLTRDWVVSTRQSS